MFILRKASAFSVQQKSLSKKSNLIEKDEKKYRRKNKYYFIF